VAVLAAAGATHAGASTAGTPVTERLTLAGLGTITVKSALPLVLAQGKWLVKWSPATIAPALRAGGRLSLHTTWPARAAVLGAHGAPLTSQSQVVTIGVEGARIANAASLKSALVAAGAPAAAAASAIAAAKAHPTFFEPVFTVSRAGTAQYGTTKPLKTDAWLMGFKGDIAFAALVVNSAGNGGPTCGPIVAKFLRGL
jgi:hypothetical protein